MTTSTASTTPAAASDRRNQLLAGLPDGVLVVVKRECATCQLVIPVLQQLADADDLAVSLYTQDDPSFPGTPAATHDASLELSWRLDIETVPTVIRVAGGREVERTVGWSRRDWEELTGVADLGLELPDVRPGCGSMSVDPDLADELRARFGADVLQARRVELAAGEDEFESLFARGWTDGLPVVPPTPERVLRMLTGTARAPDEIVACVPPDLVDVSVEKVAIAAVMAGCLPEYLPWVLTAVEAACTDEFNVHGVLATTMPVGPVLVCSGPGTAGVGMNSGGNLFGQGIRANLTIGRALALVIRNVGGGRPGEVDQATHGNPGKLSFCFAERRDGPWQPLAARRGVSGDVDALTVFAGEGPRCVVDQASRTPESLAATMAACLRTLHHPKLALAFDALLVVGPEHARVFADAGWDAERTLEAIHERLQIDGGELRKGAGGIAEGMPEAFCENPLPKFRSGGLLLANGGGGAGMFSAIIGGWASGSMGSEPVTRQVVG